MDDLELFCDIIRKRSKEHAEAMQRIYDLPGVMVSILRQELDSMVRAIYLLAINDLTERDRLIAQTLSGEQWTVATPNGKSKKVTDSELVELSNALHGWTLSVYKFGCAFIHFSKFHDYSRSNPFASLSLAEQTHILDHLRRYHGGPSTDTPDFDELSTFFPRVFEKIAANLECCIEDLESREIEPQS